MKLLLFSDLHCVREAARGLVQLAKQADVVIGAGDFANMHRGINVCLDILRQIDKPAVLVAGNNETTEELTAACRDWPSAHVLHGTGTQIEGVDFFGIGGGVPITPFGSWSFDFTEDEARELLRDMPLGGVLISHSPPKGAVDKSSSGQSLGSKAVREAIMRQQPALVVCGHIHASGGQHAMIGQTTVVNAGPAGVLWEL